MQVNIPRLGVSTAPVRSRRTWKASQESRKEAEIDNALVERIRKGDNAAFTEIHKRYYPRFYSTAFAILRDYEDAKEICNDAFKCIYLNIHHFRGESMFSTWAYRIPYNLALNRRVYWRSRQRSKTDPIDTTVVRGDEVYRLVDTIASGEMNPSACVEFGELRTRVNEAIGGLKDIHREALVAVVVRDIGYKGAAREIGVGIGTIKSRVARARKAVLTDLQIEGVL